VLNSYAQTTERKYTPPEFYYTPPRKLPPIPSKPSRDTLAIQLGAGVNVTELFAPSFSATSLIYANFDFIWQKNDILFKHFFLSVYNSNDSSETAAMFQGIFFKNIGVAFGVESSFKQSLVNEAAFLCGPSFGNHFLSVGGFYKSDETLECSTRFLHHWGSGAQLSVVGTYNFHTRSSFLLLSIVRVFKL